MIATEVPLPSRASERLASSLVPGPDSADREVLILATLVAVSTSLLNSYRDPLRERARHLLADYLPPEISLTLASHAISGARLSDSTLASAARFRDRLAQARKEASAYADPTAADAAPPRGQLTETWRALCATAMALLNRLENDNFFAGTSELRDDMQIILRKLRSARDGGEPDLDATGRPDIRDLPRMFRPPRHKVMLPCIVACPQGRFTAILKDVSEGGIGLERISGLTAGDTVAVELDDNRRLDGVVRWSRQMSAGVELQAKLDKTDPLLRHSPVRV